MQSPVVNHHKKDVKSTRASGRNDTSKFENRADILLTWIIVRRFILMFVIKVMTAFASITFRNNKI